MRQVKQQRCQGKAGNRHMDGQDIGHGLAQIVVDLPAKAKGVCKAKNLCGRVNVSHALGRYRDKVPTFNDDMRGTGAIVMSGLLNAVARTGGNWTGQRVVVFGAGTAGVGIADQIRDHMAVTVYQRKTPPGASGSWISPAC